MSRICHLHDANAGRCNLDISNQQRNDRLTDRAAAEDEYPRGARGIWRNLNLTWWHWNEYYTPASKGLGSSRHVVVQNYFANAV